MEAVKFVFLPWDLMFQENKTNCFPWDQWLSLHWVRLLKTIQVNKNG